MLIQSRIEHLPIADSSIDLIFTDPPYLVEYLSCYEWLAREAMRVLKPGGLVMAMCGGVYLNKIFRMFDDSGLAFFWKCELGKTSHNSGVVWLDGGNVVATATKPLIVYSKGKPRKVGYFVNLYYSNMPEKRFHHWGQDVGSARYYIEAFSKEGEIVLDPFLGGGTTAVACELIGRRWIGCDIDPNALATTALRISEAEIPRQTNMSEQLTLVSELLERHK